MYYKTGLISCNNSTAVTGAGTAWVANVKPGDAFVVNGVLYEIAAVVSDTALTLSTTFSGSVTSVNYMIVPVQGYMKELATQINALLTTYGNLYNSGADQIELTNVLIAAGTVANPSLRNAADPDTGVYFSAANQMDVAAGGVRSASFTGTGVNNTPVGVDVQQPGHFTTLNASGQAGFSDGTVGAPGMSFTNDTDSGIRRVSSGVYAFVSNGVDIVTVNASGIFGKGLVVLSGSVTLNGSDGVTVTHNKGDTNYLLKLLPTGATPGDVGEVSYVKAANTVTIYNTGRPRLPADYELSATT